MSMYMSGVPVADWIEKQVKAAKHQRALIEAAPDLLAERDQLKAECAVLRAALDKLMREMCVRSGYDEPTPPKWFYPRIKQARAALAKAEGR